MKGGEYLNRAVITGLVLLYCALAIPAQCESLPWSPSLGLAYAQSLSGGESGLIGKATVGFAAIKLPLGDTKLTFGADFLAVPGTETVSCGFGGSATIKSESLGISVGIGYLPRQYGWSWHVSLIDISL